MIELEYILSTIKAKAVSIQNLQSTAYPRMGNRGRVEQTCGVMYLIWSSKHLEIMIHIHSSHELQDFKQQVINFVVYLFVIQAFWKYLDHIFHSFPFYMRTTKLRLDLK